MQAQVANSVACTIASWAVRSGILLSLSFASATAHTLLATQNALADPHDSEIDSCSGQQPPSEPEEPKIPSRVPDIVRQRVRTITQVMGSLPPPGGLPAEAVAALSDSVVQVNAWGELQLEFHAASSVEPAHEADLTALSATVIASIAEVGGSAVGIVTVWIPYCQVETAAALPWVVAVRPVQQTIPDPSEPG